MARRSSSKGRKKSGKARKAKLGSGKRFAALKKSLGKRKGVYSPGGLDAYIGRKKFGAKKFAKLGAKGRSRKAAARKRR